MRALCPRGALRRHHSGRGALARPQRHRVRHDPRSPGALPRITRAVKPLQRRLDRPADAALTDDELIAAKRQVLTGYQIDKVTHLLGERGEGLNRRRVEMLDKADALHPCSRDKDTGTRFYRLGDIFEAHQVHPRRGRGSGS